MKVHLMFRDRDLQLQDPPCFGKADLISDLELEIMLKKMARDDEDVREACSAALFQTLTNLEDIEYRQKNVEDSLRCAEVIRRLYRITQETEKRRKESWYWLSPSRVVSSTYSSAVELLKIYTEMLMQLRTVAIESLPKFRSEGFCAFFQMLKDELSDAYFKEIKKTLGELKDGKGMLISARLGNYCQGVQFTLRSKNKKRFWWHWGFAPSYTLAARDDAGAQDFENRRARAINECTNALAQSVEHLESFFKQLHLELAFFIGCVNLRDDMEHLGMPICIPHLSKDATSRSWYKLYDISLAITKNFAVISNTLSTQEKSLFIITGANQGGKSTFLRSIGQAQLMAQCGMIVGARDYRASVKAGIFTHFKKEENSAYVSGKLDEELARLNSMVDHMSGNALLLMNESFAATNEREGSEICRQITKAMIENGVEVFSVTHLYTYATSFKDDQRTQFLRAERKDDESRTYRIIPGEPYETAYGEDLWNKIFTPEVS